MTFEKDRGVSIDKAFKKFHKENKEVYKWFKNYFYYFKGRGKKHISAKLIAECVRMEPTLRTRGELFKLDNCFVSRYARLLVKDFPQHAKYFEFRRLKSDPIQTEIF